MTLLTGHRVHGRELLGRANHEIVEAILRQLRGTEGLGWVSGFSVEEDRPYGVYEAESGGHNGTAACTGFVPYRLFGMKSVGFGCGEQIVGSS